jgi:cytochrome c
MPLPPLTAPTIALAFMAGAAVLSAPRTGLAQIKGDRDFGEYLSNQCVTCHQASGQFKGIPSIVGWPEESFVSIMNEYRHKRRSNVTMQTIAGGLSDDEVSALAAYFGSVALRPDPQ